MKIAKGITVSQGDVFLRRVSRIPENAVPAKRGELGYIIAESETHHHHAIDNPDVSVFDIPGNPLLSYLKMGPRASVEGADIIHHRAWDTHETIRLLGDGEGETIWEIRRQREWTPEGWRRVAD